MYQKRSTKTYIDKSISVLQNSPVVQEEAEEKLLICPYCGEELNFPKTPKFCPYCREQIQE
jgi:rubrerythrin